MAQDIMTTDVVTVTPEMPVNEIGAVLVDHRIHGAPVVDENGRLLGMVSLVDLVGRTGDTAEDVMTPDPICAFEDTPVDELASAMLDQAVRRIPIVRDGAVVGIVSASDIIALFLNLHEGASQPQSAPANGPRKSVRAAGLRPRRSRT